MRFRHRARDVLKKECKDVARFMWLDDRVYPAASGAVADIGLFFVIRLNRCPQFLEVFRRRFLVATFRRASQHAENRVGSLGSTHHRVARVRPSKDEPWVVGLAAERVVAGTERATDDDRDL